MDMTTLPKKQGVGCRFCSLLQGATDAFDSAWLSEGGYRAIVSVGALVSGWSLVCPVNHVVNLSDEYTQRNFWKFASDAARVLEDRYGPCAFFEHGASNEASLTGCGVGHAHGHLVPLSFSLEAEACLTAPEMEWRKCFASEVKAVAACREYLFVADKFEGAGSVGSLCILTEPTSQFFRRLIARKIGIGDLYDYKKYPMLDMATQSASELRDHAGSILVRA